MPKVSIIMPVYNTGEILNTTIKSILNQTYSDWELILIDDGSSDTSGSICDTYSMNDSRIRTYHKDNGGICNSRNYGLEKASGQYIAFCDHDDVYHSDLLETAIPLLEKNGADVIKYRYKNIDDEEKEIYTLPKLSDNLICVDDLSHDFLNLADSNYYSTVWSFIYKKNLLNDSKVLFDESYKRGGEDFNFNVRLAPFVHKLIVCPDVLYTHYIRQSLSTSAHPHEDVMYHFLDSIDVLISSMKEMNSTIKDNEVAFMRVFSTRLRGFCSFACRLNIGLEKYSSSLDNYQSVICLREISIKSLIKLGEKHIDDLCFILLFKLHCYRLLRFIFGLSK